jgi:hypothetical protein
VAKEAPLPIEIIRGKGSGALKKHVLRFLDRKEIKALPPPGRALAMKAIRALGCTPGPEAEQARKRLRPSTSP